MQLLAMGVGKSAMTIVDFELMKEEVVKPEVVKQEGLKVAAKG